MDSRSVAAAVAQQAADLGERRAFTFIDDDGTESEISFAGLHRRACDVAGLLRESLQPGDRALLMYPPGFEYICALLGCFYAGVIGVPLYPPNPKQLAQSLPKLVAIAKDSGAAAILTTQMIKTMGAALVSVEPALGAMTWLATDRVSSSGFEYKPVPHDSIAYLQYTSGSTGTPKGVVLSHANLVHNVAKIRDMMGVQPHSVLVSWLPPFHDMGLIGCVLAPIAIGIHCVLMSPMTFLRKPYEWLSAMSRFRGTIGGGPNFGYDLCVRRIPREQRVALDLSTWEVAFNGAEAVRADTIYRFVEAFGPCGFNRKAFFPCYGLAEASLIVSGPTRLAGPRLLSVDDKALSANRVEVVSEGRVLVSSGHSLDDGEILIVAPETTTVLADGQVGEILTRSASVARGYWENTEATAASFGFEVGGVGGFLRTGDLGFLRDGELYVTGRRKDLIIVRGKNHYPTDLELTVDTSGASIRPGCTAVFSVDVAGEERVVVVAEAADDAAADQRVVDTIVEAVTTAHQVEIFAIVIVRRGAVPKTSSGKLQRRACRELWQENKLNPVFSWVRADSQPEDPRVLDQADLLARVLERVARLLNVEPKSIDASKSLMGLGLDSLKTAELAFWAESEFAIRLTSPIVFELMVADSIRAVATILHNHAHAGTALEDPADERELVELVRSWSDDAVATRLAEWSKVTVDPLPSAVNPFVGARRALFERLLAQHRIDAHISRPLAHNPVTTCEATFAQHRMWDVNDVNDRILSPAETFAIHGPLDIGAMQQAMAALVDRQAALRTVFALDGSRLIQSVRDRGPDLDVVDLSSRSDTERVSRARELLDAIGLPHDLGRQPFRVQLVKLGADNHQLLVGAHHIVLDKFSRGVLWTDLSALYRAIVSGTTPDLPRLDFQFSDFCFWQRTLEQRPVGKRELAFWANTVADYEELEVPGDLPTTPRTTVVESNPFGIAPFALHGASWDALTGLCTDLQILQYSVIATAFLLLLSRSSGRMDILAMSGSHHRKRPGTEALIGNLITPYPLRVAFDETATLEQAALHCHQTVLAHQAQQGVGPTTALTRWSSVTRYNLNYIYKPVDHQPVTLGRATVEQLGGTVQQSTVHDLALYLNQSSSGIHGSLVFNARRFSQGLGDRLAARFRQLLDLIVTERSQRVSALPREL